jgi:hypothetical protein
LSQGFFFGSRPSQPHHFSPVPTSVLRRWILEDQVWVRLVKQIFSWSSYRGHVLDTNLLAIGPYTTQVYPSEAVRQFRAHFQSAGSRTILVRRLGQAKWSASLGTNVLDSLYRRLEYLSEFLKSKPFDHHHRSVIKAALLHSFSSACLPRPVRLELLNINPLITRGQRSLLQSSSSALHCYFNVINPSRHFSSVAPPTQFSQSAPASRFYKPVDPPFPF